MNTQIILTHGSRLSVLAALVIAGCGEAADISSGTQPRPVDSVGAPADPIANPVDPVQPDPAPEPEVPALECEPHSGGICAVGQDHGVRFCRSTGTWSCCRTTEVPTAAQELGCRQAGLLGTWKGSAAAEGSLTYTIELSFYEDGTYEARCPSFGGSGPGLCLSEDGEPVRRGYELTDMSADGTSSGRIEAPEQKTWSFITDLRLSEDEEQLSFQVWSPWNGEEVIATSFRLSRTF